MCLFWTFVEQSEVCVLTFTPPTPESVCVTLTCVCVLQKDGTKGSVTTLLSWAGLTDCIQHVVLGPSSVCTQAHLMFSTVLIRSSP